MKVKCFVAASLVALIATGSVKAADVVHYQDPVAPTYSWTGFYIGAQNGYEWGDADVGLNGTALWSPSPNGLIGGFIAGYNTELVDHVVLALETDVTWADIFKEESVPVGSLTGRLPYIPDFEVSVGDVYKLQIKQKWMGLTRFRAGYAVDRILPYVSGGVAYGNVDAGIAVDPVTSTPYPGDIEEINPPPSYRSTKTLTGWTAGAGIEHSVTDNVILRVDYRYIDLGRHNITFANSGTLNVKYRSNDFRFGIAYKF